MALELGDEYKEVAKKLINKFPQNFGNFNIEQILFLKETSKSPKKYADTRKVNPPYTFMTNTKFIITFYERVCEDMTPAQLHLLVMHELMHIDDDFNKLRKHDLEDFRVIISLYGPNWDIDNNLEDILDETDEIQNNATIDDDDVEIL
jgi:predicted metallopeptidase